MSLFIAGKMSLFIKSFPPRRIFCAVLRGSLAKVRALL
jgi:hypothetical protein